MAHVFWPLLALGLGAACGPGTADGDGSGGSAADETGGSGSDEGSGGEGGGGTDASGGNASSGGSEGDGGAGTGSATGGGGTGGAESGTGGDESGTGGTDTGGSGTGGFGGSGDSPYDVTLGDDCSPPGAFACSAQNEFLALICDASGHWVAREACEAGERCDDTDSGYEGLCREVLPECIEEPTEPFCGETGVEACLPGGFDKELVDDCEGPSLCAGAECVSGPDACPADFQDSQGCGDDCTSWSVNCENALCGPSGIYFNPGVGYTLRLSGEIECTDAPEGCADETNFVVTLYSADDDWYRVEVGRGWEMAPYFVEDSPETNVCGERVQECLILRPQEQGDLPLYYAWRSIVFYPLSDPPIERNVTFTPVAEGSTCP